MPEKTAAQKRAQKAYMEKFAVARVRMDPEKYEHIQSHAATRGESVNGFINRAIQEAIDRDNAPRLEALGEPVDDLTTTIQPIPRGTLATAAAAAKATGEAPVDFIVRAIQEAAEAAGEAVPQAIEETADRDALSR